MLEIGGRVMWLCHCICNTSSVCLYKQRLSHSLNSFSLSSSIYSCFNPYISSILASSITRPPVTWPKSQQGVISVSDSVFRNSTFTRKMFIDWLPSTALFSTRLQVIITSYMSQPTSVYSPACLGLPALGFAYITHRCFTSFDVFFQTRRKTRVGVDTWPAN